LNWYLRYGVTQKGPLSLEEAQTEAATNPDSYAWKPGMAQWMPISRIEELRGKERTGSPPPFGSSICCEVDFTVFGTEMQYVEIELDPGESAIAEAGVMMYKDSPVHMESIFGDGSEKRGLMGRLAGAGKRVLTGAGLFMTQFRNQGNRKAAVAFGAPYPGNVIPISLPSIGRTLICQKDSFLCAAKGVSIDLYFQKKILTGLFGGEGFIMQKLSGDGMVFVHAGGTVKERILGPGEEIHVDTGCIVAFEPSVGFDIRKAGNVKTMLFGGEGFFFARLQGPGKVWLQSLPFSRLAGRMLKAAPQHGGKDRGEGSIMGGLGNFLNGDNRL